MAETYGAGLRPCPSVFQRHSFLKPVFVVRSVWYVVNQGAAWMWMFNFPYSEAISTGQQLPAESCQPHQPGRRLAPQDGKTRRQILRGPCLADPQTFCFEALKRKLE